MSNGVLPPVPDLIPISALRKGSPANNNSTNGIQRGPEKCAPCASIRSSEVMGEQRSRRRTANQHPVELIDSAGSRGLSAAPQAPRSRKVRSERHRKSDRRREHRKPARSRSASKHYKTRETHDSTASSPERPINPRVNPIFVWVRQEDTYIVDVKCEDYDKRNRILLTKTAQGWRAIPRTETLVPSLKEAASKEQQQTSTSHHHHHHHKNKRSRKNKVRRRSTGVQVCSDIEQDETTEEQEQDPEEEIENDVENDTIQSSSSPSWMSSDNVNVESLLPSHTIKVKRSTSPDNSPERDPNVNSVVRERAQTPSIKCSADKICDVSPLDNLLAVAELEFNQQIQSGEWNKTSQLDIVSNEDAIDSYTKGISINEVEEDAEHKEFIKNLEQLNDLIESEENKLELQSEFESGEQKSDECDYTEEDDNNLAMDDILSRLEQSLQSPDGVENSNCDSSFVNKTIDEEVKNIDNFVNENDADLKSIPDLENYFEETESKIDETNSELLQTEEKSSEIITDITPEITNIVESSTMDDEDQPTDLSVKTISKPANDITCDDDTDEPTDLSIPKSMLSLSPRPPSQNSEAIQSPQPSGIPAVPQSPDIVSTSVTTTANTNVKPKSVFLESLLSNNTKKIALNSEVTIIRQEEPLDLGKNRKSASPTVTCSEEVDSTPSELEPPTKKFKSVDITLKHLLDTDVSKVEGETKTIEKTLETPRLLELLKSDAEPDPLTQLKQLLADPNINIPDPMLVPKEKFSVILTNPAVEIPKLLKERPELRLPEALAFPHIMQDPNMLVLSTHHLESILANKNSVENYTNTSVPEKTQEAAPSKKTDKVTEKPRASPPNQLLKKKVSETSSKSNVSTESQNKNFSELANDIDVATQAAFNQMMWLPYLNQLEAMSVNNSDIMKMFANSFPSFPMYQNQMPDFSHMFGANRFPTPPLGFPLQPPMNYGNPLEMNMWQEAMMQANMLRNKNNCESFNNKHLFKDYLDKINVPNNRKQALNSNMNSKMHVPNKQPNYQNVFYPNGQSFQNLYGNIPPFQSNNSPKSIQIPQYNSMQHQKNIMNQQKHFSQKSYPGYQQQQKMDSNQNINNIFSHLTDQERNQYLQSLNSLTSHEQYQRDMYNSQRKEATNPLQKPKLSCKSFASLSQANQKSVSHHDSTQKEKNCSSGSEVSRQQTSQPIDLSGSTTSGSKLKVKQHLIDPANTPKLLKHHDDVPEVGSTTASVEEMQDAHKHLWHPLFGK